MKENQITMEQYIEHEVQIRVLNTKHDELYKEFVKIDQKFDKIESKIESRFLWIIGLIITSIILPVLLHSSGIL